MTNPTQTPIPLDGVTPIEVLPGFHGRFVHSGNMTFAYWTIEQGTVLPEHAHVHEQVVNMLEGEFELVVQGVSHVLVKGDILIIPGNITHGGRAITECKILDVFQPVREDYQIQPNSHS